MSGKNKYKIKIEDPGAGRLTGGYEKSPAWVSLFGRKCWVCDAMANGATECCLIVN